MYFYVKYTCIQPYIHIHVCMVLDSRCNATSHIRQITDASESCGLGSCISDSSASASPAFPASILEVSMEGGIMVASSWANRCQVQWIHDIHDKISWMIQWCILLRLQVTLGTSSKWSICSNQQFHWEMLEQRSSWFAARDCDAASCSRTKRSICQGQGSQSFGLTV